MGNCASAPLSSEEEELQRTLNEIATRSGKLDYEDPAVKAFRAQWERVPGVTGGVYGEQDKAVDYLYVLPQVPFGRHDFERFWNEPEKAWMFTDPQTGARGARMTGIGLGVHDNPLKACYSSSIGERGQRGIVWTSDLSQANPVYLTTTCLPKSVNAGRHDELVLRWPMSNWDSAPELIKQGIRITLEAKQKTFKEVRLTFTCARGA